MSHETIYKSIYVQGRGELRRELAACLRSGRAPATTASRGCERRGRIPDIVSISERPAEADDRAVPGHWEGDLIMGTHQPLSDRHPRRTLHPLRDPAAPPRPPRRRDVRDAMAATIQQAARASLRRIDHLGPGQRDGRTRPVHHRHRRRRLLLRPALTMATRLQREHQRTPPPILPKGTGLVRYTAADLQAAADSLNGRPRQTLNWRTPTEALTSFLATTD